MSKSQKKPPDQKHFEFGPWIVSSCKSHILESEGTPQRERFESDLELPQLPEMVFAENYLKIEHETGVGLQFCALDALRLVDAHSDPVKVAASEEWQNARSGCEHIKNVVSPFDWTYTTNYTGTLVGAGNVNMEIEETQERIDVEKLKRRDAIGFYDDILLFEDELSDNGTSMLSVKVVFPIIALLCPMVTVYHPLLYEMCTRAITVTYINQQGSCRQAMRERVMPSCFFVLMRLFIRVDQVMIRVNDTRIYHEAGSNYLLREFSSKEESTSKIPTAAHTDPNEVGQYLTTKTETFEKLTFRETQ